MQEGDNHLEQKIDIHNLGNVKIQKTVVLMCDELTTNQRELLPSLSRQR